MIVKLNVNINCPKLGWIKLLDTKYRVYVDEELITERNWSWDYYTYIDENIWVDLDETNMHKIRVCSGGEYSIPYTVSDLRIDNKPKSGVEGPEIAFYL